MSTRRARFIKKEGFTLIEILLVTSLMVLFTSTIVLRMNKMYRGLELQGVTHEITLTIEMASDYAVRNQIQTRFVFENQYNQYWVESERDQSVSIDYEAMPRGVVHEKKQLPNGITIQAVDLTKESGNDTTYYITCQPDGRRDSGTILLTDRSDRERYITVGASLGRTTVSETELDKTVKP